MTILDKSTLSTNNDSLLATGQPRGIRSDNHRPHLGDVIDSNVNLAETALQTLGGPLASPPAGVTFVHMHYTS